MLITELIKSNQGLFLNGTIDQIFDSENEQKLNKWNFDRRSLRRTKSMDVEQTKTILEEIHTESVHSTENMN